MTTTPLVTDTRTVADQMEYAASEWAGNIGALSTLSEFGPTTLMACQSRIATLGGSADDLFRIADSLDNARTFCGNLIALSIMAGDTDAVRGFATTLEGLEP
jgi:hypothetical protein